MVKLSHLDEQGRALMVDVGDKPNTQRRARAEARVRMAPETLRRIGEGGHEKGDVLAVARVAAVQAAKKTDELIPLCHSLPLDAVDVQFEAPEGGDALRVVTEVRLSARTGAEMEALTAASVASLTVYDMCKAVDKAMTIEGVRLLEKEGGRSGAWQAPSEQEEAQ